MKPLRIPGPLALALSLLLLLAGCPGESTNIPPVVRNPKRLSCDIFTLSRWKEFRFGIDSPEDVAAKAISLWGIEQTQVYFSSSWRSDLTVAWKYSISGREVYYEALFGEEQQLQEIDVSWQHPFASLSQVLDCLGPPDLYSARFEFDHEPQLDFRFWFVAEGFAFRHFSYPRAAKYRTVRPGQRIDHFSVFAPPTFNLAFPDLYAAGSDPAWPAIRLCLMKPWPGSIEKIEVTWHDDDPRCQVLSSSYWY